jgi:hypothetical protein
MVGEGKRSKIRPTLTLSFEWALSAGMCTKPLAECNIVEFGKAKLWFRTEYTGKDSLNGENLKDEC